MMPDPNTISNISSFQISGDACNQILRLDKNIRFACIIDFFGHLVAAEYREGLQPLLSREESELSFIQSIIRMNTRRSLEAKLGRTIYSFTCYERVKRASIPLGRDHILIIAFDLEADHDLIIREKIFPLLGKPILTS
jgi:hypothetical protein